MIAARRERIAVAAFWLVIVALLALRFIYPTTVAPAPVETQAPAR